MQRIAVFVPLAALTLACAPRPVVPPVVPVEPPVGVAAELAALHEAYDVFALRDRLATLGEAAPGSELRVYRGVVAHAFNRPAASNEYLTALLDSDLPPGRAFRVRELIIGNHLRLFAYRKALEMAESLLASGLQPEDLEDLEDVANQIRLLSPLAGVGPQRVIERRAAVIPFEQHATGRRVPVAIGGTERNYLLDSGANLSVLMRSEAEALGLEILPAGLQVGTSTDLEVTADLAVAPSLRLGGVEVENVVFLVMPDSLLSFPEAGIEIRGILGFPLFEALGELRFVGEDRIEVPQRVAAEGLGNLALRQLHLLTRVGYAGEHILCALDTGANKTAFYASFHRRFRRRLAAEGREREVTTGGVGGSQVLTAVRLPSVRIEVGGADVVLEGVDVYLQPLAADKGYLECNLGQDALDPASAYTLNLHSMSLKLELPGLLGR